MAALRTPFGHHARLPEDSAQPTRLRGQGVDESPSAGLAGTGPARDESLPALRDARLVAG